MIKSPKKGDPGYSSNRKYTIKYQNIGIRN